jgi:hypothetical protein
MRIVGLTLAVLLVVCGTASGQVAAPLLNPTPTVSLESSFNPLQVHVPEPSNPAVLPWDGPSRVGASYGVISTDIPSASVHPGLKGHMDGVLAEAVGKTFAAAIQANFMKQDFDPAITTGVLELSVQRVGVAAQFGDRYSVAIGNESVDNKDTSTGGHDVQESLLMAGATVRIDQMIYLGAAGGTATIKDKLGMQQVKRNALQYGIAYLWRGTESAAHVEVFHSHRPAKVYPNLSFAAADNDINGYTVEAMVAHLQLGYSSRQDKTKDQFGNPQEKDTVATVTLGYDIAPGLAIIASKFTAKSALVTGGTYSNIKSTNLGVAWQF